MGKTLHCGFHRKEWVRPSKLVKDWLVNNFRGSGTGSLSLVVRFLTLEWLGQVNSGLEGERQREEIARLWTLDWLVCIWRTSLGTGSLWESSARPRMSTHQHTENGSEWVKSLSRVHVTRWTVAYQVPPSMGFSRQELEWVAISFSRRSSLPRDWTWVSRIVGRWFTVWATREVTENGRHG